MIRHEEADVAVIGGGPAGATAAAVLARHGRRVVVVEKARFPRYHVGESLMPYCYFTLERLGVVEKIRAAGYPEKHSVQFVRTDGRVSTPFYFFQHLDHPCATTWQVWRDEFDALLLRTAADAGARVLQPLAARALLEEDGRVTGVRAVDEDGETVEVRAAVTVDASGRDMFTGVRKDWRMRDPKLSKISMWTYYDGAVRDPGLDAGATTVAYLPGKGWFWYIPTRGDRVSVGIVAERDYLYRDGVKDPAAIFEREIPANPWIAEHLAPGEQTGAYWVTGDYSYRSRYCAADGLVLVGDAFAFLDPVFSSGVFLALKSGELGGDAVHAALASGDVSASAFAEYGRTMRTGLEAMRKLVYAFYDERFSFADLIRAHPERRGDLTDCLIGDLFRDLDALFEAVGRFADLPQPLAHGRPLTPVA